MKKNNFFKLCAIAALILIIGFTTVGCSSDEVISINNKTQLEAALNSRGTEIVIRRNIMLDDGEQYNFAGKSFTSGSGILIIRAGAEVTVTGTGSQTWGMGSDTSPGVSRYLQGQDETAWLYRPDAHISYRADSPNSSVDPNLTRRFWDKYAANAQGPNPHWCPPFAHDVTTISVRNEGQLRAALASTAATKDKVVLMGSIDLIHGTTYNFTGINFVTSAGSYSIAKPDTTYHSPGGKLMVPAGATVTITGTTMNSLASVVYGSSPTSKVIIGATTYSWVTNAWQQ